MNYFRTADEAAARLGLALLHRADADSRALVRKDRLAAYATDPVQSAHAWGRVREELRKRRAESRVLWLTGPFGGMGQLPWAVGFAEQLARGGDSVLLGGPEIPSLLPAHRGARSRVIPAPVRAHVSALIREGQVAVATDLEGVRIVAPHFAPMPPPDPPADAERTFFLWVQSLPEELGTRLPLPDVFDGVVFVASFRDHTPFELEACVRQLQTAGHPLLGLVAIGAPGTTDTLAPPASGRAIRPASIWDDSSPRRGDESLEPASGEPIRRGHGGEREDGRWDDGSAAFRASGIHGRPGKRENNAPDSVTETSWAHLAGGRASSPVAGPAAGSLSSAGPPTTAAPGDETKRLLDRLSPRGAVGDPGRGAATRGPSPVAADAAAWSPEAGGARAPAAAGGSVPEGGGRGHVVTEPGVGSGTRLAPPSAPASGRGEEPEPVRREGPEFGGTARKVAAAAAAPGAATAPGATPASPSAPAGGAETGRPDSTSADRSLNLPPVSSETAAATGGSEGPPESPAAVKPAGQAESRTVPLIGLWEREHRREGSFRKGARTAATLILDLLAVAAAYWFGTGHSLEELKALVVGTETRTTGQTGSGGSDAWAAGLSAPAGERGPTLGQREGTLDAPPGEVSHPGNGADENVTDGVVPGGSPPDPDPEGDVEGLVSDVQVSSTDPAVVEADPSTAAATPGAPEFDGEVEARGGERESAGSAAVTHLGRAPAEIAAADAEPPAHPDTSTADPEPDSSSEPDAGPDDGVGLDGERSPDSQDPGVDTSWVVHLSSLKGEADATAEIARLQRIGIEARAVYVEVPDRGPWYRVVVGRFTSFIEARRRALQLSEQLDLEAVHVIGRGGLDAPVPIPVPAKEKRPQETPPEESSGEGPSSPSDQAADTTRNR